MNEEEKQCIQNAVTYILTNKENLIHNKSLYNSLMVLHKNNVYKLDKITLTKLELIYGK